MLIPISSAVAQILGIMLLGLVARRLDYIREEEVGRWSRLVVDFLFPALAFSSIIKDLDNARLQELWLLPVIGYGMYVVGFLVAFCILPFLRRRPTDLRRTFHHLCVVNNSGILPIIVIQNLWGPGLLPDLFLLNVGTSLAVWTIGVAVLGKGSAREVAANLLSPNVLAILAATVIAATPLRPLVPSIVVKVFSFVGAAAVPCSMLLTGAGLLGIPFMSNKLLVALATVARLVIIPAACLVVLGLLPLPEKIYRVSAIVALMPSAVTSTMIALRFGGNATFASQVLVASTVASVVTVPLGLMVLFG